MPFLPTDQSELKSPLDIILVTGDAYIDHPSFGPVLIARYLEAHGFSVGIIAQPDWKSDRDFLRLGRPRLFFGVSAGNLDSMVANYTADKKIRRNDMYSPNNEAGHRPDRAAIVYTNKIKQLFPGVAVVLGGVEASLRRFAHYDYWSDLVRRPILFDAKADYLVYGMGEKAILEIAEQLKKSQSSRGAGQNPKSQHGINYINNSAIIVKDISQYKDAVMLPSYEEVAADKRQYAEAFRLFYTEGRKRRPRVIIQPCLGRFLVVFPPKSLSVAEFENLFTLPFMRLPHPMYKGCPIPAWDFVKFSTVSHRGCFGGCSFCAIAQHQGKYVVSRGLESIKKEVKEIIMRQPGFKGQILDIGGPTSNMYGLTCSKPEGCTRASCIYPAICKNLGTEQNAGAVQNTGQRLQAPARQLLSSIRQIAGIKNVFVNSGVRYDLALLDEEYLEELVQHHVSGQLSVAPEHLCEEVLLVMGKPSFNKFLEFKDKFEKLSGLAGRRQFVLPYFIASHPGCTLSHALELALFLRKNHIRVEQVQNFTPTPMTPATCMYYTGLDPFTGKAVHVPKGEERSFQRALLQPQLEKNYRQVVKALKTLKKEKLIKYLTDGKTEH
ncbi:MAG: YgiQ family radical SAM protein [Candidatus Margulisiibacteriota bacterium]